MLTLVFVRIDATVGYCVEGTWDEYLFGVG